MKTLGRGMIVLTAWLLCSLGVHAATRVALVTTGGDAELAKVQDTALVLLGNDAGLEMVERAEINRVLQEQQLSLAGVVGGNEAVKAGQLLHADLFAVLEGSLNGVAGQKQPLALIVFDARTGVRYADSELAASNTIPAAAALADALRAAVMKSRQPANQLHTVCLLLVRNADLPREFDKLCYSVGPLLEREMLTLTNVAVLERRRLAQINEERRLGTDDSTNHLLASLQMVELDISQAGAGWRGTIGVVTPEGVQTNGIAAVVATRTAADLAHDLASQLQGLPPAIPTGDPVSNRVAEAKRFERESDLHEQQRENGAALEPMEAAYALAPELPGYKLKMIYCLCDGATEFFSASASGGGTGPRRGRPASPPQAWMSGIALANRAADLLTDLYRETLEGVKPNDPVPDFIVKRLGHRQLIGLLQVMRNTLMQAPTSSPELLMVARKERDLRVELLEPFYRTRAVDAESFTGYGSRLYDFIAMDYLDPYVRHNFDPQRWREDYALVLRRWAGTVHRVNPPDGSGVYPGGDLLQVTPFYDRGGGTFYEDLFKSFEGDKDPIIQLSARLGVISCIGSRPGSQDSEKLSEERNLRLFAESLLAQDSVAQNLTLRDNVWSVVVRGLDVIQGNPLDWQEYLETCRFAFAQHQPFFQFFRQAIDILQAPRNNRPAAEQLEIIDGAITLAREADLKGDHTPEPSIRGTPMGAAAFGVGPASGTAQNYNAYIAGLRRRRDLITGTPQETPALAANAPQPEVPLIKPWRSAAKLLDVTQPLNGLGWLLNPVVDGSSVYVAAAGFAPSGQSNDVLQVVRVPLGGGQPSFLGKIDGQLVSSAFRNAVNNSGRRYLLTNANIFEGAPLGRAACIGAGRYFLATPMGVYTFPIDGSPVERLCTTNGLPSDQVRSLAFLGGKLYIGAGEIARTGYLISYDPKTRALELLASNRRSEHLSPFDDQPPFLPLLLTSDSKRQRVILLAAQSDSSSGLSGFWEFAPDTREFKHVASAGYGVSYRFGDEGLYNVWKSQISADTVAVSTLGNISVNSVAHFDLRDGTFAYDYRFNFRSGSADGGVPEWKWPIPPPNRDGTTTMPPMPPPLLPMDGWLWTTHPFGRRTPDGAKTEQFIPLRMDYPFEPRQCLRLLDDGRHVLAEDALSLWLLELASAPGRDASRETGRSSSPNRR